MNYWMEQALLVPCAAAGAWYAGRYYARRRLAAKRARLAAAFEAACVYVYEDNSFILMCPENCGYLAVTPVGRAVPNQNTTSWDTHFAGYGDANQALKDLGFAKGFETRTTVAGLRAVNANLLASCALPGWVRGETP